MDSYQNFPPINIFKKVLQSIPQSALVHAGIWGLRDKLNKINLKRKDVNKLFYISPTLFENHLLSLARLGFLEFEKTKDAFKINLLSIDD